MMIFYVNPRPLGACDTWPFKNLFVSLYIHYALTDYGL